MQPKKYKSTIIQVQEADKPKETDKPKEEPKYVYTYNDKNYKIKKIIKEK